MLLYFGAILGVLSQGHLLLLRSGLHSYLVVTTRVLRSSRWTSLREGLVLYHLMSPDWNCSVLACSTILVQAQAKTCLSNYPSQSICRLQIQKRALPCSDLGGREQSLYFRQRKGEKKPVRIPWCERRGDVWRCSQSNPPRRGPSRAASRRFSPATSLLDPR